jgi:hypothetical protein
MYLRDIWIFYTSIWKVLNIFSSNYIIFLAHIMKTYGGSRNIVPLIFNLSTRWKQMVNFTPRPLYPRVRKSVPTENGAGWAQEAA